MKRKIFKIMYIINIIVIIAILTYLIYISFSKYRNSEVTFRGYKLDKYEDLAYSFSEDTIAIDNDKDGWHANINIMNDPNNVVFSDTVRINEILRYKGYKITDGVVQNIGNEKYITFEMDASEYIKDGAAYFLFGYYKQNDDQICEIMINDTKNITNYKYDAFERVVNILNNTKYDAIENQKYHYATLTFKGTLQALYGEEAISETE